MFIIRYNPPIIRIIAKVMCVTRPLDEFDRALNIIFIKKIVYFKIDL